MKKLHLHPGLLILDACSLLPLWAWGQFTVLTRNPFRLEAFGSGDQLLCVGLTGAALLMRLGSVLLQKKTNGQRLTGALADGLFGLGACGWILTLGTQWSSWAIAVATESIGLLQQNRLRFTALGCLALCLVPLIRLSLGAILRGGSDA